MPRFVTVKLYLAVEGCAATSAAVSLPRDRWRSSVRSRTLGVLEGRARSFMRRWGMPTCQFLGRQEAVRVGSGIVRGCNRREEFVQILTLFKLDAKVVVSLSNTSIHAQNLSIRGRESNYSQIDY